MLIFILPVGVLLISVLKTSLETRHLEREPIGRVERYPM